MCLPLTFHYLCATHCLLNRKYQIKRTRPFHRRNIRQFIAYAKSVSNYLQLENFCQKYTIKIKQSLQFFSRYRFVMFWCLWRKTVLKCLSAAINLLPGFKNQYNLIGIYIWWMEFGYTSSIHALSSFVMMIKTNNHHTSKHYRFILTKNKFHNSNNTELISPHAFTIPFMNIRSIWLLNPSYLVLTTHGYIWPRLNMILILDLLYYKNLLKKFTLIDIILVTWQFVCGVQFWIQRQWRSHHIIL